MMKTRYLYLLIATFIALTSCEEDATPVLELSDPAVLHPLAQSEIVMTKDNKDSQFPEITWEKANYGAASVVKYEVTLTNEANKKSVLVAETGDNKIALTNGEMNALMAKVGAYPGQAYDFTLSLVSKAFDVYTDAASNNVKFKATSYDPNVDSITWKYAYVAVGYPDWDYTTAYLIGDPDGDGVYKGYVNFEEAGTYAIVDGKDITKVLAKNIQITDANKGFVEVSLDAQGKVSQSDKSLIWGIVGDATSNGWNKDTEMEYDTETRLWTLITSLTNKEFKFRANNDWSVNYGPQNGKESELNGNLVFASQNNFKVAKSSPYIITLNLTQAGKYTYNMEETSIVLSSSYMVLPGSYQSEPWKPEAEDCYKVESAARDFKYSGIHYFPATTEFKFNDGGIWYGVVGEITWDEANSSANFTIGDGNNIQVKDAAYYKINADLKKMTASLKKTGWEIIGDATPGSWDRGTLMDYDANTKTWSITIALTDGEFKFRWDASWDVNFGGSIDALTQGGDNMKVSVGTYKIVLNPATKKATMEAI